MQIRAFFLANPSIHKYFCSNLKPQPHPETEEQKVKSKLVSVTAIVNVAQTAKKATCLTTITQYNSTSSLTPAAPSTRIRIFSKTEIFFLRLHLPPTRKQYFRSHIWRFLKTLSRLDIYRRKQVFSLQVRFTPGRFAATQRRFAPT